jgi:benzoate membrane transport protein
MLKDLSGQAVAAGVLAAVVGFASSFAVILRGLAAMGADQAQAASGLMAASMAMGLGGVVLSLRTRQPVSVAWSTPGAALLASTGAVSGGFGAAVGAFMAANALIVLAGLWRPLGRAVAAIPAPLANAMLAGVLLGLCLAPVHAVGAMPALALPVVLTWALVARVKRLYAVPAAAALALALIAGTVHVHAGTVPWPAPVLVVPRLVPAALLGVALPLFIVTMASQNIPGMAVLHANGFRPPPGPLFRTTGLFGLLAAPFGSHAVNLAAITAAMCAGPEAHPDPQRRYWAATVAGLTYVAFGLLAGVVTAAAAAAPPLLIEAVAGLALLGAFGTALMTALADPASREAAAICFLVTGSGVSFLGVGGAAWGLLAGGAVLALGRWRDVSSRPARERAR